MYPHVTQFERRQLDFERQLQLTRELETARRITIKRRTARSVRVLPRREHAGADA